MNAHILRIYLSSCSHPFIQGLWLLLRNKIVHRSNNALWTYCLTGEGLGISSFKCKTLITCHSLCLHAPFWQTLDWTMPLIILSSSCLRPQKIPDIVFCKSHPASDHWFFVHVCVSLCLFPFLLYALGKSSIEITYTNRLSFIGCAFYWAVRCCQSILWRLQSDLYTLHVTNMASAATLLPYFFLKVTCTSRLCWQLRSGCLFWRRHLGFKVKIRRKCVIWAIRHNVSGSLHNQEVSLYSTRDQQTRNTTGDTKTSCSK